LLSKNCNTFFHFSEAPACKGQPKNCDNQGGQITQILGETVGFCNDCGSTGGIFGVTYLCIVATPILIYKDEPREQMSELDPTALMFR
jgi:hypothetical protein